MVRSMSAILSVAVYLLLSGAAPIRREVPQEHSHQSILTSVQTSLSVNNPAGIVDAVFGLLGNAAAAAGAGTITNLDCLQQATADQAFTNAKAASDVEGMTNALIYRALERNTGSVGLSSVLCNETATNPEIAAITQHQDPASSNAAATNKAITLALAKQIASIGGNPQDALKSGTFAPGNVDDTTGKGNTCDDANDAQGCIFSQNLLVPDATADEISAAVAGVSAASGSNSTSSSASSSAPCEAATVTVTVTSVGSAATATASTAAAATATASTAAAATATASTDAAAAATASTAAAATATASAAAAATATAAASSSTSGGNLQTFTGALGGISAPAVTAGGRGFVVENSDDFVNVAAALGRSCDIQHNQCADKANSGGGFSVGQCDTQDTQCKAATSS